MEDASAVQATRSAYSRAMGSCHAPGFVCDFGCEQVLSDEAKATLQEFYLKLRQQITPGSSNPITVSVCVRACTRVDG